MYKIAFVCMLFLQLVVYSASYYVTQAIVLKKLQSSTNPLATYRNHALLLLVSSGSIVAVFHGIYLPVIVFSLFTILVGSYLWFSR